MDLNMIWFILIAILYTGFFVLEGFDFGVGILLPFLGKGDTERRVIINSIGPFWDGNEVWLLTAGGATFAAFPHWYATMFSGFYIPLFLLLIFLILRGVAFEFRSKDKNPKWRKFWDWALFAGSFAPALLLGVAFANIVKGVPINAQMEYTGGFWNLLNPYGLLGGISAVAVFTLHGGIFLSLKTKYSLMERARDFTHKLWLPVVVIYLLLVSATFLYVDTSTQFGIIPGIVAILAGLAILLAGVLVRQKRDGWAFVMTSLTIIFTLATFFLLLYPRVMISSLNPEEWSLTIYNAASGAYTLRVMSIIALIFVPIVLAYQGWTYWIFRKRLTADPATLEY